jgi:hypothetical protein
LKKNEFLYITDKLDVLDERLDDMEKVLILQEENLKQHMDRTKLLEEQVSPLNKFMYATYGIIAFILFCASAAGLIQYLKP